MSEDRLLAQILDLVRLQLGAEELGPADRLVEDLGAESADLLNLVAALEDRYRIEIDEAEVPRLATVADLHRLVRGRLGDEPRP